MRTFTRCWGTLPGRWKSASCRQVNQLEAKRDQAWRAYDEAARAVDRKKNDLLDSVEGSLQQRLEMTPLFTVSWKLV